MLILKIWEKEVIPIDWKDSIICPIYKKGDRMQCKNYRPVTMMNVAVINTQVKLPHHYGGFTIYEATTKALNTGDIHPAIHPPTHPPLYNLISPT